MCGLAKVKKYLIPASPLLPTLFICLLLFNIPLGAQQLPDGSKKIDPFYLNLYEEGIEAFNRGNFEEAFECLKIAAFGLLDEPDLLGAAFVYLTLSAYNLKKTEQVEHYLKEISRFRLGPRISGSSLPREIKEQFARIQSKYKNNFPG
ncbi:MAG: hypothetical protein WBI18_09720 [Candidatus Saccharicenans sp.]